MRYLTRLPFVSRRTNFTLLLMSVLTLFLTGFTPSGASAATLRPSGELPPSSPQTVYTAVSRSGCLALNANTGAPKWLFPRSSPLTGVSEVFDGLIYFGEYLSSGASFYALNAQTGTVAWKYPLGSVQHLTNPGVSANGLVYFGLNEYLYALNARTGAFVWRYKILTSYVATSNIADREHIYFGAADGSLYALNPTTGAFLWRYQGATAGIPTVPALALGVVYFGTGSTLYAIGGQTGDFVWRYQFPANITSSIPRALNQKVYIGTTSGSLYALNWTTGTQVWVRQLANSDTVLGPPNAVTGGSNLVIVGDGNKRVYALNWDTGATVWKRETVNALLTGMTIAGGAIYATAYPQPLYKLQLTTGAPIWSYNPGTGSMGTTPVVE